MTKSSIPARAKNGGYAHPEILLETDWLEAHLGDPELLIFDCTAYPAPNPDSVRGKKFPIAPQSGRAHYDEEHIPGAGFIDVPGDLADKSSELPMMMPPEAQFVAAMAGNVWSDFKYMENRSTLILKEAQGAVSKGGNEL